MTRDRRSCCSDWAAHWRLVGEELRQQCSTLGHHPFRSWWRFFTGPLWAAFIWFLITLYFDSVLSVVAERGGNDRDPPLVDQGFKHLGSYYDSPDAGNYFLYGAIAFTVLRFLPIWPCVKPAMSVMVFRRWLFLEGVLFFFRGFSVAMTSVPQPNPQCVSTATGSIWAEGIYVTFGKHSTCGDCMFSGHTAAITLLVLLCSNYSHGEEITWPVGRPLKGFVGSNVDASGDPAGWKLIDIPLWSYLILAVWVIIKTRFHYSHDTWMGFLISYFVFKSYHFYLKCVAGRNGSLFARFVRWFENIDQAIYDLHAEQDLEQGQAQTAAVGADGQPIKGVSNVQYARDSLLLGNAATESNFLWRCGRPLPPTTLLPLSYLVGHEYYRPGLPTQERRLGLGSQPARHAYNPNYSASAAAVAFAKPNGNGVPPVDAKDDVRLQHPLGAGQGPYEAPQGVRQPGGQHASLAPSSALHNFQQPAPTLVAGEMADSERREIERETGVRMEA